MPWTTVTLPRFSRAVSRSVARRKAVMGMEGYFSRKTLRNAPVVGCEYSVGVDVAWGWIAYLLLGQKHLGTELMSFCLR